MSPIERSGRLRVVGTPIGNLEDLSPRGQRALSEADAIFCEDTRVTAKLAARFSIGAKRISCPAPRESARVAEMLERLLDGDRSIPAGRVRRDRALVVADRPAAARLR